MSDLSIFSGSSRFSTDFQQVIQRSVSIASLPLTQLASQRTALTDKQAAYGAIGTKISAVRTAVEALASAAQATYSATSTDGNVATVSTDGDAMAGEYVIEVKTAGAFEQCLSLGSVADPLTENLAAAGSFDLVIDGVTTTITPKASTLTGLVSAINDAKAGVQASIINLGSPSSPKYMLSLRSAEWKDVDISLQAGGVELIETLSDGSEAAYTVNGLPDGAAPEDRIATSSPTVTVAPGVNVLLKGTGSTRIAVTQNTSTLSAALNSFAKAYNDVVQELGRHRGQGSGVLKGDSQISTMANQLRSLINFDARSITALGLKFDQTGKVSVQTPDGVSAEAVPAFLGAGAAEGFLFHADEVLDALQDDLLASANASLASAISRKDSAMEAAQNRIDLLEQSLNSRMAAADALIASLEQNVNYFNNLFTSMRSNRESNS